MLKNEYENEMYLEFMSKSENESFARITIAAFVAQLDPTIEEISDIKTAVSEAVTNSIIHGYDEDESKFVHIKCEIEDKEITIIVEDFGNGIEDLEMAMQPLYTSKPELERSGMGFTVMESFMDEVEVSSNKNEGTRIVMKKKIDSSNRE